MCKTIGINYKIYMTISMNKNISKINTQVITDDAIDYKWKYEIDKIR